MSATARRNGLEPEIREGLYPGDYLIPVGEALKAKYGDSAAGQARIRLAGRRCATLPPT